METLYEKIITNNLSDDDKKQVRLILDKYNHQILKYINKMEMIKETLPPNKFEKETKVEPKKAVGRPRIHTEEENKQIKREITRTHYLNNIEKRRLQKKTWFENNRETVNARARYNKNKKLENALIIAPPTHEP